MDWWSSSSSRWALQFANIIAGDAAPAQPKLARVDSPIRLKRRASQQSDRVVEHRTRAFDGDADADVVHPSFTRVARLRTCCAAAA